MPRINLKKLPNDARAQYLDLLWTSIANLKDKEEVKNFFKDLLSEGEAIMLSRRITIAKYLLEGKSYDEINRIMSAGCSTIASVHQWLISGFGGYEMAIKKFNQVLKKRTPYRKEPSMPYTFSWLKKKYPLHFLLFNIFDKIKK